LHPLHPDFAKIHLADAAFNLFQIAADSIKDDNTKFYFSFVSLSTTLIIASFQTPPVIV
jgi:hypothetical protein